MLKNKLAILTISVLVILNLVGFSHIPIDNNQVEKVELAFEGNPVDSYSCVLTTSENIKESLRIYQLLKTYKSPSVETWYETVTYKIYYKSGKVKENTFQKIRPVTDIFEKVFSSLEVRKQWEDVFTVKDSEVSSIRLESLQKKAGITINYHEYISKIISSVKLFEEQNRYNQTFTLCDMKFFNEDGEELGSYYIKREDVATNLLLKEYEVLNILKVEPKDIKKITISNKLSKKEIEVVDLGTINLILDTYYTGSTNDSIVAVRIQLKNDNRTHLYGSYNKDQLPAEVAKILKIK